MKPLINYIRSIPNFPKPGVIFRDVVPLIEDRNGLHQAIDALKEGVKAFGQFDKVAVPEARGFIFGAPLAYEFNVGLTIMRKPGKLPYDVVREEYELEYGTNTIEMHVDSITPGERILLVDDLLATGGTIKACRNLIEKQGGVCVGAAFIIELVDLKGREALKPMPVFAPVVFEGE